MVLAMMVLEIMVVVTMVIVMMMVVAMMVVPVASKSLPQYWFEGHWLCPSASSYTLLNQSEQ